MEQIELGDFQIDRFSNFIDGLFETSQTPHSLFEYLFLFPQEFV